ncbi:MAG: DUF3488 domain-containing protein [Phycisphaeraceae bacterium]|nr:DUF3488 domain-containing protein [Phycisphaeraceae bacterium]
MRLDAKLRSALFWMIGIGVQVYCIAEANVTLSMLAAPVWLLAWPVSMSVKGRPLPKLVLGLIALGLTIRVLAAAIVSPEDFVAAVSRYIVWLQLLKLFDRREPGDVAQAMALSVFLVLGSCLTSNSMWLGVGLLVYTPAALWGITIYQLYAEALRTGDGEFRDRPVPPGAFSHLRRLGAGAGVAAMGVAVVVFLLMPRGYGEGFLGDVGVVEPVSVSGVPEEVRLGESGLISTSFAEVLSVVVTDEQGRNVGELVKPLYLKALTLDEYANGRWRQSRQLYNARGRASARSHERPLVFHGVTDESNVVEGYPVYEQRIRFLTGDRTRMPTMNRAIRMEPDDDDPRSVRVNAHDITLFNVSGLALSSYTVWSQPDAPRVPPEGLRDALDWRYPRGFEGSAAQRLAQRWIGEAGLSRDPDLWVGPDDHEIARLFEARLQKEFDYTLEMIAPEPGEDPIDMFLTRTKAGHCEYFASTMTAMLRSLGIDARVVTGYAATEYNETTGAFLVRENQSHAWVEARTEPDRWRTYDPSPSAEVATAHQGPSGLVAFARRAIKAANAFWIDHIVGFDRNRQAQALGSQRSRLRAFFEGLWPTPPESPQGESDEQINEFRAAGTRTLIGAAIQVAGLVVGAFGLSVALIILMRRLDLFFEARQRRHERLRHDPEHALRHRQAAFFRRYQKALRRAGHPRGVSTTPMAHALALGSVSGDAARDGAALTALYYRLRFGQVLLGEEELEQAERLLGRITSALRSAR